MVGPVSEGKLYQSLHLSFGSMLTAAILKALYCMSYLGFIYGRCSTCLQWATALPGSLGSLIW